MRKDKMTFSGKGHSDLEAIAKETMDAFHLAVQARKSDDVEAAAAVDAHEKNVDSLEKDLREKHIRRLSKGKCEPESGVIFLDIISNLERVADHATNIAGYVESESKAVL